MIRADQKERLFTPEDLFLFGVNDLAYVKTVAVDGKILHAIYAADGTPLMVAADRDLAFAAVRQNNLQPASVH
jgi:hypothetical protein